MVQIKKQIKKLYHSSIIRTIIIGFLFVIIPVMLLYLFSAYKNMKSMQNEVRQSYSTSIKLISNQLSDRLRDLEATSASLLVDRDVVNLSADNPINPNLYEFAQFHERLSTHLNSKYIEANVTFFFPAQKLAVSTKYDVEFFYKYHTIGKWEEMSSWAIRQSLRDPNEYCLSYVLGYVSAKQTMPIIAIEISEKELVKQLASLFEDSNQITSCFLLDFSGKSIYAGQLPFTDLDDLPDFTGNKWNNINEEDATPFEYVNNNIYYTGFVSTIGNTPCGVGILLNESEMYKPIKQIVFFITIILIFMIVTTTIYIIYAFRSIYKPFNQLLYAMEKVGNGDFTVRAITYNNSEFSQMSNCFNKMTEDLNKLLSEKYINQMKLKDAQVRFLKSQINPHFLYNSLFSLYNMIESNDLTNASDMAIYLGRYYQRSAHFAQNNITFAEEIENTKMYLDIYRLRTQGKLQYNFKIDDTLMQFKIPVLSIQTIAENAITHAFQTSTSLINQINIFVLKDMDNVIISVEDNGTGISKEDKEHIIEHINIPLNSESTHGLQNVYSRLKIMFGENITIQIISNDKQEHGSKITFIIPFEKFYIKEKEDV